ncbi:MAG: nucleotidyl transferase AbiEii/AbiGii toxin family protein [Gammaproteobacteria bacterium]|nr:nucleotidyl transferase AbiEii/AbiGii toxin family protein [Gammaproteobacteria bacterium]
MAFKGGTSLSKVYNLINRFSEDIDVTIDYRELLPNIDLSEALSKSALKKLREQLEVKMKEYTRNKILPFLSECIKNYFPNETFNLELSEDGEKLRVHYPTLFESGDGYLQTNVLIEFGGCNSTLPSDVHTIKTILSEVTGDLILPIAQVKVLNPSRTFWEKATLIHVECHRGRLNTSPERLSRHWYDLAKLFQSWVGKNALSDRKLLEDVIVHKKAFFNASYANYDDCLNKKFRLIPGLDEIKNLKSDFNKMENSGMIRESSFDNFIEIIKQLEMTINT